MRSILSIWFLTVSVLVFGIHSILQGATLEGLVLDATDDSPLENATVRTSYGRSAQTDEEGFWRIEDARPGDFNIHASMQDYLDSTLTDLHVDEDDTLEINFSLLRAEFIIDPDSIFVDMLPDEEREIIIEVSNNGDDPLSYTVERRLIGEDEIDPWALRDEFGAEDIVNDDQINGVVVVDGLIYISGGNNGEDNNFIYVFNADGELQGRFDQFVQSRYGMFDLTWDGNLIWGADDEILYGFNTEGELVETIEGQARSYRSLAWDPERNVFWSADVSSDIYATNLNGEVVDDIEVPGDMRIYGLSYWTEDPDGFNLYIMSRGEEVDLQVNKIDIENGNVMQVREMVGVDGRPGGIDITNQYDAFNWVMASIILSPDRVMVWQLAGRMDWFQIDPEAGQIAAGESDNLTLTLNSMGLPVARFDGLLIFMHDRNGGEIHVPVTLNVVAELPQHPPSAFNLLEPEDGDTLQCDSVQTFIWEESIDPDEDALVIYQIWFQGEEDSIWFDVETNSWEVPVDELVADFDPGLPVTWWVKAISDPDTVECNNRFVFHLYPPERPPSEFNLLEPENDDTLQINSLQTFIWEESIDPNPDDVVGYQIWFQGLEDSVWFDAQSNSWEARVDTLQFYIDAYFRVTWWVKAISDPDTVESNNRFVFHLYPTSAGETYPEVPCVFAIQSVQPNPFNSTTTITYGLDKSAPTRLALYDLSGRQVRTLVEGNEPAGVHRTILSAANLPSGLYFVRLEASNQVFTQKVMLIR